MGFTKCVSSSHRWVIIIGLPLAGVTFKFNLIIVINRINRKFTQVSDLPLDLVNLWSMALGVIFSPHITKHYTEIQYFLQVDTNGQHYPSVILIVWHVKIKLYWKCEMVWAQINNNSMSMTIKYYNDNLSYIISM